MDLLKLKKIIIEDLLFVKNKIKLNKNDEFNYKIDVRKLKQINSELKKIDAYFLQKINLDSFKQKTYFQKKQYHKDAITLFVARKHHDLYGSFGLIVKYYNGKIIYDTYDGMENIYYDEKQTFRGSDYRFLNKNDISNFVFGNDTIIPSNNICRYDDLHLWTDKYGSKYYGCRLNGFIHTNTEQYIKMLMFVIPFFN